MKGLYNVVSAVLFTALLAVFVAFMWSILAPVMDEMRHVDPPWTVVEVGNVVNFRESVVPLVVELSLTCDPVESGQANWTIPVWVLADRQPGRLLKVEVVGGRIMAVYEGGYYEGFGASFSVNYMYKARYLQVVYTNLTLGGRPLRAGEPIYGGPVRIEATGGESHLILPKDGQMTCVISYGDTALQEFKVNWAIVYKKTAEVK